MFSINENEYTQMTDEKLIENTLQNFEKALWVLTPEEKAAIEAAKSENATEGEEAVADAKEDKKRSVKPTEKKESKSESRSSRSGAKEKKAKKPKAQKSSSSSSSSNAPVRSVRRTK